MVMMIKLNLRLNQTQKIRYDKAMEQLQSLSSSSTANCVIVADSISKDSLLKGHGISQEDGEFQSLVCGVVERVDNLVHVRQLRAKYTPVDTDIVVGRVIEVGYNLWRVDINSLRYEVLKLESVNTNHHGVLRRRSSKDELNMRNIFVEDDVICVEVCKKKKLEWELKANISHKYGKLVKGQLLKVDHYLVKRTKSHFHYIESLGIDLILGHNGFIWIGKHKEDLMTIVDDHDDNEMSLSFETRQSICKTANAIRVLSNLGFTLTREVIMDIVNLSNTENIDIHDMLGSEFHVMVAEKEAERRRMKTKPKLS